MTDDPASQNIDISFRNTLYICFTECVFVRSDNKHSRKVTDLE